MFYKIKIQTQVRKRFKNKLKIKMSLMEVMDMNNLFVRISYNVNENVIKRTQIRNNPIKSNKYLIAGGFYNKNGGTVVCKAKNLEEVRQITKDNPLLKNVSMRYDVVILPKNV